MLLKPARLPADGEPMSRSRSSFIALLAVIPMLAACGSSSASSADSSPTSSAPSTTTQPTVSAKPANLVLHLPDLGYGYIPVVKDTKKISLAAEIKTDSPASKRADKAGYKGGYTALYANASKGGVSTTTLVYKDEASATTVGNDPGDVKQLTNGPNAHQVAVPANAPGTNRILVALKIPQDGHTIPGYALKWQHGTTLSLLLVFGKHVSLQHVMALANVQDRRITNAGF
jgi:hypothetical protein